MKTKKPLPAANISGVTQFVADIPIESVITVLVGFPRLEMESITSLEGHDTFKAYFNDTGRKIPIYLSMKPWNKTETMLLLSYHRPRYLLTSITIAIGLSVLLIFSIIGLILFESFLAFMLLMISGIALIVFIAMSGNSSIYDDEYRFDGEKLRLQEDLMNYIVDGLMDSSELQLVEH